MKSIVLALIFCACAAWASDREEIEKTVSQLGVYPPPADLFTVDFDSREELSRLRSAIVPTIAINPVPLQDRPGEVIISTEPWGEATILIPGSPLSLRVVFLVKNIRFLTPEVALVDAQAKTPLLIVLRKEGPAWKIASLRILAEDVFISPR